MFGAIANFALPILKNVGRSLLGSFIGELAPRAASALGAANIPLDRSNMIKAKVLYDQTK